jgi:hypothetical protein
MATDSFLSLACAGILALGFGLLLCFAGYRLFVILLPIWGFFFGLVFGAQAIQALFGVGFLASVTSWVVGFLVGAVFAVLAYLFYTVAVAIFAGSVGYSVVVGIVLALGLPMGWLLWLIGLAAGIIVAIAALALNLQKWIAVIGTALLGAETIIATFVMLFNPAARAIGNPREVVASTSPLVWILAIVVAVLGILVQLRGMRTYQIEAYSRWE